MHPEAGNRVRQLGLQETPTFEAFVQARGASLWRAAWLLTGDAALAEDLVQTALAKTWAKYDRVVANGSFEAYVRRAMMTSFVSWRRRRWGNEHSVSFDESTDKAGPTPDFAARVDIARALDLLSPRQRAVVVMRYFEDLTETEAARILGCSRSAVKTHHRRALNMLRASYVLREHGFEE